MNIRLQRLELENFKGVRSFTLNLDSQSATVRGDNATGKTTLADAFSWLLFGKDTAGKADFQIKTVDEQGQELSGLDHAVEAVLEVDGQPLTLRKVYQEKWVKQRGSATSTFTGHEVKHFVDGVPVLKKDWDKRLGEPLDEDAFKLLTNPSFFNSLHWQRRREILMQVCGDVEDRDVIGGSVELRDLPEILGNRKLDDHRKVVAAKRSEINKRLQELPARIDELSRSTSAAGDPDAIKHRIDEVERQIMDTKAGCSTADLRKRRAEIEAHRSELVVRCDRERREALGAIEQTVANLRSELSQSERKVRDAEQVISDRTAMVRRHEVKLSTLRDEFRRIAEQAQPAAETCPACGQSLPRDQVEAAAEKANALKASRLEGINAEGKRLKGEMETWQVEITKAEAAIEDEKQNLELTRARLQEKQEALGLAQAQPHRLDAEIQVLANDIANYTSQIEAGEKSVDTSGLEAERRAEQAKLAAIDAAQRTAQRIDELKAEEKKLSAEYEDLERQLYLMDRFIVAKVNLLEEKINGKFEIAQFKLFETQINGGVAECCTTLCGGVPYNYGLNRGAEIQVGLDIIKTLSRHYGVSAPIWIDNREAVTKLPAMDCQVISLVVDPSKKELEVTRD